MRILVVGDTHGDINFVRQAFSIANRHGCDHIMQVGDFGVWPGIEGNLFLDRVSNEAIRSKKQFTFLPGNHEDWDQLDELSSREPDTSEGFWLLRENIAYTGKINQWYWGHHKFGCVGGAYSIDKSVRIVGKSWWPQEQLTDGQAYLAMAMRDIDVLFTHDCPTYAPFSHYVKDDPISHIHRSRINAIVRAVKPPLMFHGHMHSYYDYMYGNTQIYGLECNTAAMPYYNPRWDKNNNRSMALLALGDSSWQVSWPLIK